MAHASQSAEFEDPPPGVAVVRFVTLDGQDEREHVLGLNTQVGRHTDNDVQLLDPEVSKIHLTIERRIEGFVLRDLESANGTLVNEESVSEVVLKNGDVIAVGNSILIFRFGAYATPESSSRNVLAVFSDKSESTMVTLTPEGEQTQSGATNIFALPMQEFMSHEPKDDSDVERLKVAFEFAGKVGLESDLGRLGEQILDRILDILDADTAVIMLADEEGGLVALSSRTNSERDEVHIPRAIVEQVVTTRTALLVKDALEDDALRQSHTVVGQQIRSAICVPLLVDNTVYGLIHLSSSMAVSVFEERDLQLLRAIAQPAALAVANARLVTKARTDAKHRAELSRFLSPALVERVVNEDLSMRTHGDLVQATVLFSDIRGFTALSDGKKPEAVVAMLNEYFAAMVEVVFQYGGVLDKFIGDGLMAVWGTPVRQSDDTKRAVEAACAMRQCLSSVVNSARLRRGEGPLEAGFGIATGRVVSGAIGGTRRQDFTVIGDVVNLASRLCSQAKANQILTCQHTAGDAETQGMRQLRELGARSVKGVQRPVNVFEVPLNR